VADTQTPDYQSAEFARFCPLWDEVDACLSGTEAMRSRDEEFHRRLRERMNTRLPQMRLIIYTPPENDPA